MAGGPSSAPERCSRVAVMVSRAGRELALRGPSPPEPWSAQFFFLPSTSRVVQLGPRHLLLLDPAACSHCLIPLLDRTV